MTRRSTQEFTGSSPRGQGRSAHPIEQIDLFTQLARHRDQPGTGADPEHDLEPGWGNLPPDLVAQAGAGARAIRRAKVANALTRVSLERWRPLTGGTRPYTSSKTISARSWREPGKAG